MKIRQQQLDFAFRPSGRITLLQSLFFSLLLSPVIAEPPGVSYIFPAGGQRGTKVEARVGGFYFHGQADFHLVDSSDIEASPVAEEMETVWFEGPLIFQPASQKSEDYPRDHRVTLTLPETAPPGDREWYCSTAQGTTSPLKFVVGEFREKIEREIDGEPVPETAGALPVTINGRIFPREDVDVWEFQAEKGDPIVCEVASRRLGYPLEAVLSVQGPKGERVRADEFSREGDAGLSFTAPATGVYRVQIVDANFLGYQNYVYRLTLRKGHRVLGHFPIGGTAGERVDVAVALSNGSTITLPVAMPEESAAVPVTIEGRTELLPFHVSRPGERVFDGEIDEPGKTNAHSIDLAEGETISAEILAHEFGSGLDGLLGIEDAEGKRLKQNDDREDRRPDSRLVFTAKNAGRYSLVVGDQFSGRGGPGFGYRLRIVPGPEPVDFELQADSSPINVHRMTRAEAELEDRPKPVRGSGLTVSLVPFGALKKDIELTLEGLPDGVELEGTKLSYRRKRTEVFFLPSPEAKPGKSMITLVGRVDLGEGKILERRAETPIRFTVAPAVPFRHTGQYWITNDHPCGSVLVKQYRVERFDGFDGPIRARLADRQIRHLQGVTAPVVDIPAGATEFEFPITFPPRMELGRTSRVQLMLVGEVDGKTVSFTTRDRNEQMITITTDGLLHLSPAQTSFLASPRSVVRIPLSLRKDRRLAGSPVRIEADIPPHFRGVSASPLEIPDGETSAVFEITLSSDAAGPFNQPLRILASTREKGGFPHTAETRIELVQLR